MHLNTEKAGDSASDVNKDLRLKAKSKAKDLDSKAKVNVKDLSRKAKAKDLDFGLKDQGQRLTSLDSAKRHD